VVDVSIVVNVLFAGIVIFRISHQHKVLAGDHGELHFHGLSKRLVYIVYVRKSIRVQVSLDFTKLQHDRSYHDEFAGISQQSPARCRGFVSEKSANSQKQQRQ